MSSDMTERAQTKGRDILTSPVKKNNQLLKCARELRRKMTPQERRLWYCFLRSYPVKVYKQRIIDSFIADFYCASARLVIEIDGGQHYTEDGLTYDTARTGRFEKYDLKVIRFTNREVDRDFPAVCQEIDRIIRERRTLSVSPGGLTAPPEGEPGGGDGAENPLSQLR